jgi:hypothetical protein
MLTLASALFAAIVTTVLVLAFLYRTRIDYEDAFRDLRFPRVLASDYVPHSGDIVFANNGFGRPIINMALDGFFHHVGIVLDVDGAPVMLESLPPRAGRDTDGLVVRLWSEIIASNVYLFAMPLNRPLDARRNAELVSLTERNYAYPSHPELIKRFLTAQATDVADESAHCYDVIALALKAIGFADLLALSMAQKSKELERLYERELPDGYRYLPPIEIIPMQTSNPAPDIRAHGSFE